MEALGINIVNIIIYTLLFVVLYVILNKYLLKGLVKMLDRRQQDIKDAIAKKEELDKQLLSVDEVKTEAENKAVQAGQARSQDLIKQATEEAQTIIATAKVEAERIIEKANKKLDVDKKKLEESFMERVDKEVNERISIISAEYKVEIDKARINKLLGK